jgi:predicted nucleic acid-binding protein
VIYLDTCALIKLIRPEPGSAELAEWLNTHSDQMVVTSELSEVEVPRALRRSAPARLAAMPAVLAHVNRIEMDAAVRATAGAYPDPHLRSLDAIHLATADTLAASGKDIKAFVTYDKRLAAVAADAGHTVVAPGE